jgi:hypothetical protein
MDLDHAKTLDQVTSAWARTGMFICFAAAAGILFASLLMPTHANDQSSTTLHSRQL